MENILNHLITYKFYYLFFTIVLLIIILFVTRPKKVKPIDITIDDVKKEKTDIEKVLESLEENKDSRPMTTFEEEQEANAIISYQELVEAVKLKKESIEEKEEMVEKQREVNNVNLEILEDVEEIKPQEEMKKFKSSEFISPVFGKDSNKTNDEFLKELKDFRNSL